MGSNSTPESISPAKSWRCNRLPNPIADSADSKPGSRRLQEGVAGCKAPIRYNYLGESSGFGSSHLCRETVAELELLLSQSSRGRRVNSIFGEGVSPRLRKIRDGLDILGFHSDVVLKHGNARLVYGVAIAPNFREVLLGQTNTPKYALPQQDSRRISRSYLINTFKPLNG